MVDKEFKKAQFRTGAKIYLRKKKKYIYIYFGVMGTLKQTIFCVVLINLFYVSTTLCCVSIILCHVSIIVYCVRFNNFVSCFDNCETASPKII